MALPRPRVEASEGLNGWKVPTNNARPTYQALLTLYLFAQVPRLPTVHCRAPLADSPLALSACLHAV
jgi:hypothetical protein